MNQRGSEWNIWDLHVHTPVSFCSKYGGDYEAVWSKFFTELENLPKEVKVLGINDYLFLDGYKKVLEHKKKGGLKNIDLILPVIEFRIKEFVGSSELNRINYHIIFADETLLKIDVIESHFLSGLRGKANLNPDYTNGYSWGGVVTKESLIEFGEHIYNSTPKDKRPNEGYIDIGFNNINFEISKIKELLGEGSEPNTYLNGKYLKAIGKAEWESFRWDGSAAEKKTIINDVHFIFSASPTPESANNGISSLKKQNVNSRVLHCSDAHQFAEEKNNTKPNELGHCFTWLKAETTFEGLKQIIFEPDLRRKIQFNDPNNKRLDNIIKSVRFEGHSAFIPGKIYLNPDLNTVIGGKSSGKSLLLHYIAHTIDSKYAINQERRKNSESNYKFSQEEDFNFIIEWEDEVEYRFKENETVGSRQFVYIPQSYIINLASNIQTNSRKELGKFIREILKQEKESKDAYDEFIQHVKNFDKIRNNTIEDYFKVQDEINSLIERKKEIGDIKGIKNQISLLNSKVKELRGNSIEEKEVHKYKVLNKTEDILSRLKNDYKIDYDIVEDKILDIETYIETVKKQITFSFQKFKTNNFKSLLKDLLEELETFNQEMRNIKIRGLNIKEERFSKVNQLENKIINEILPIREKLRHSEQIKSIEDEIKEERIKLQSIENIDGKIKGLREEQSYIKSKLFSTYRDTYLEYEKIIKKLNHRALSIKTIDIKGSIKFYYNRFRSNFIDFFNQKSNALDGFELLSKSDNNHLPDINFEEHLKQIEEIFNLIIENKVVYKKYGNVIDSVKALFKDEFFDFWELSIGNDEMASMSPGQANLAILKLIIELSESNCPILIDQPEDNLDNRSIYNDLVEFIRKRKENRQLIIVTHNPNIVVGGDSENIIVANQKGQDKNRENKSFRFEYIGGAIENTFTKNEDEKGVLYSMGIREHVAEILEGGEEAFRKREKKYGFSI